MICDLVLVRSPDGRAEAIADAAADGARPSDALVDVWLVPTEVVATQGCKASHRHPVVEPLASAGNVGVMSGGPTRSGLMAEQVTDILDRTGGPWATAAQAQPAPDGVPAGGSDDASDAGRAWHRADLPRGLSVAPVSDLMGHVPQPRSRPS